MRVSTLLFVLVFNVSASATLERPSPTPGIASQPPQSKASNGAQITNTNQHDTEKVMSAIKVRPADKADDEAAQSKKEKEEKASADRWIVRLTAVLALVGFLQLIVFGLQARRLRQTIDEMKNATKATEKAANATEKSVELAREEFNLTHRPRVIVRGVSLNPRTFEIEFVIANIGDTRATICQRSEVLWLPESIENLPATPPYGDPDYQPITLERCESVPLVSHPAADVEGQCGYRLAQTLDTAPNKPILFVGYLFYEDSIKRKYLTAFMRTYDFGTQRFKRTDDPDYEYQD
jgi:hypothetical protein